MGLPGFFGWFLKQYKKNNKIITSSLQSNLDILYLDANCLFHPQCFHIINVCSDCGDTNILEDKMIKRILVYIDYLIGFVNPKKEVMISVDGVAPMAKMNQQRKRRFRAIDDAIIRNEIKAKHKVKINKSSVWNNTVITPGTVFMEKLHQAILKHIKIKVTKQKTKIKYTYSSYHTPGEGEHKILQNIKNRDMNNNETYIIYGLDADLIFLSLASQRNKIFLLREEAQVNGSQTIKNDALICDPIIDVAEELVFVSIDEMKKCFCEHLETTIVKEMSKSGLDFDFDLEEEDVQDNKNSNIKIKLDHVKLSNDFKSDSFRGSNSER